MRKKIFYGGIFCILVLSLGMLTFSYSKESGFNSSIVKNSYDDLNVVYSDYEFRNGDDVTFTVANNLDVEKEYSVKIELNGALGDVYYIFDNGEEKPLVDNVIYVGKLNPFGNNNDVASHSLNVYSKSDVDFEYTIDVNEVQIKTLYSNIIKNSNVYLNGDTYYFYGEQVNNYVKYDGDVYRIVKMDSSNVLLINESRSISSFNPSDGYLNVVDYLATFKDNLTINDIGNKTNWLSNGFSYWISGDQNNDRYVVLNVGGIKTSDFGKRYFTRTTKVISKDLKIISGDGSINNPFEV